MATIVDGSGTRAFTYTFAGLPLNEDTAAGRSLQWSYDEAGRKAGYSLGEQGAFQTWGGWGCSGGTLAEVCQRSGWGVHAYVLMSNHCHFLLETPVANLVRGMTWLQTTCTTRDNARHRTSGHLFGGQATAERSETDSARRCPKGCHGGGRQRDPGRSWGAALLRDATGLSPLESSAGGPCVPRRAGTARHRRKNCWIIAGAACGAMWWSGKEHAG